MKKIFLLILPLVFLLSNFQAVSAVSWTLSTIDSSANVGQYSDIVVAHSGNILISYYDVTGGNLKFAKSTDGGANWSVSAVDTGGDVGKYSSIAVDASDNIIIAYYDTSNFNVKFAKSINGGTNWSFVTVTPFAQTAAYTKIAVDDQGNYLVVYQAQAASDLIFAKSINGGANWATSTILATGTAGLYLDFVVDSAGNYLVSHTNLSDLLFAKSTDHGANWVNSTAEATGVVGRYSSIAVGPTVNDILVSHWEDNPVSDLVLTKSSNGGTSWTTSYIKQDPVHSIGQNSSIAYDSFKNKVIVVFDDFNSFAFGESSNSGTSWTISQIAAVSVGNTSLTVDSSGNYLTTYYSGNALKFAKGVYVPPSISLTSLSPDPTTDSTPNITGTATDAGSTLTSVEFQMDGTSGGWTSCVADDGSFNSASEPFTCLVTSTLGEGGHTIYVRATNADGATTSSSSYSTDSFTVDTVAPLDFDLSSPTDRSYTSSYQPNFCFKTSTDATSGLSRFELLIGGDTKVSDIKPTCQGGLNFFNCRLITSATSTSPPSSVGSYEDNDKRIEYQEDKICVHWKQFDRNLKEGTHYWKVKAIDNAGNSRETGQRTLYVDYKYVSSDLTPTPTPIFSFFTSSTVFDNPIKEESKLTVLDIKKTPKSKEEEKTNSNLIDVSIKVVNDKNIPVEGAKVTLHSTPKEETTNKEGIATFKNVEKGNHQVEIAYQGYQGTENISLNDKNVKSYIITVKMEKTNTLNLNKNLLIIISLILFVLVVFVGRKYLLMIRR
jgi:hypothetical protein